MQKNIFIVTQPTAEPISLDEAKLHLRVTSSAEDSLITALITAARSVCENQLGRALLDQEIKLTIDRLCYPVELPRPLVRQIVSVKYYDGAGVLQTLAPSSYSLTPSDGACVLYPAYGQVWPAVAYRNDAVQIQYRAGWTSAAEVPEPIKQWIKLHVGTWYEQRKATSETELKPLPFLDGLLDRYRIWKL